MADAILGAEGVLTALREVSRSNVSKREILQLAASRIRAAGTPYTDVYIYMLRDGILELEAYDGRETEHTSIPVGTGLCGKAVAQGQDINSPDVNAEPDYLACNLATKSELIVLIRRGDEVLGQIDVDSDIPNGFNGAEHAALKRVADRLAALL